MPEDLTPARAEKLFVKVLETLEDGPFRAPRGNEGETAFTRGVLAPALREFISGLHFPGLLPCGDGAAPVTSAHCLGSPFYPDIAIEYFRAPIIAIEVKLLRASGRQNAIATAVGQASIYRQRYRYVGVMLIDTVPKISNDELAGANKLLTHELHLPTVVRRRSRENRLL